VAGGRELLLLPAHIRTSDMDISADGREIVSMESNLGTIPMTLCIWDISDLAP
jgi:hypothetical protein